MDITEFVDNGTRCICWSLPNLGWEHFAKHLDEFISHAIQTTAFVYDNKLVEWLEINHWPDSGRLIIYPSEEPGGQRTELVCLDLMSIYLQSEWGRIGNIKNSIAYQRQSQALDDKFWDAVRECLRTGKSHDALDAARRKHPLRLATYNYTFGERLYRLVDLSEASQANLAQDLASAAFLESVETQPIIRQATIWIDEIRADAENRKTRMGDTLDLLGCNRWKIATAALAKIGPKCMSLVLETLESAAIQPEFNEKGSPEWEERGAFTPSHAVTSSILCSLEKMQVSDQSIERLRNLLQRLFDQNPKSGLIGTNTSFLARTLHKLRPNRFPDAVIGGSDNQLLNWQEYGLVSEGERLK